MKTQNGKTEFESTQDLKRKGIALRAARLLKGLSRQEAAKLSNCSVKSFDQIENARKYFSEERLRALTTNIGYKWNDFLEILDNPNIHLHKGIALKTKQQNVSKPRRNTYKVITKASRIIKILRTRKEISQCEASKLCGYPRCTFGQLEHGRIELPTERIVEILSKLDIPVSQFDKLMQTDALRDEVISDCTRNLKQLDDDKLDSVLLIIKSFLKAKGV